MEASRELENVTLYMVLQPSNWSSISVEMHNEAKRKGIQWEVYRFQNARTWLVFTEQMLNFFKAKGNPIGEAAVIVEHKLNFGAITPEYNPNSDDEKYVIEPIDGTNAVKNIVKKKPSLY
jgi:hypothetical protein